MYFNIHTETNSDGTSEVEIRSELSPYVLRQIHEKVQELQERYGPERYVGPITFVVRSAEPVEVLIGTQKQGDVECFLGEYDILVER